MPEVHGKGLNKANIRDTYQQEVLEGQQNAAAATKAAQQMIAEKITRESKAKQDIYGEVLGNMYDGDREAILAYRNHIKQEFQNGTYSSDPSMYETRISNLNSMIENAENFYKTTYGDDPRLLEGRGHGVVEADDARLLRLWLLQNPVLVINYHRASPLLLRGSCRTACQSSEGAPAPSSCQPHHRSNPRRKNWPSH